MAKDTTAKRTRKGRGDQGRRGRRALATLGGVVVAGGLGVGLYELRAWARSSDRFRVEHVDVQGVLRAEPEAVVRLAGVGREDNLFVVDTEAVRALVEAHPWVARAEVDKDWPRALRVVVQEHEPVALVALGHLYYAEASGEIVKRYAPGERADLPVVTGLSRDAVEAADPEARRMLLEAIAFVAAWGALSEAPLAEVHVDEVRGIAFTRRGRGARVEIGHAPWAPRLSRLARTEEALAARGVQAEEIEMGGARQPNRVVVRRAGATAMAGEAGPKAPKRALAASGE